MGESRGVAGRVVDMGVLSYMVSPLTLASDLGLPISEEARVVLPVSTIRRGSTVVISGRVGSGTYSLLSMLLVGPSAAGLGVAILGIPDYSLSAARSLGVDLSGVVMTDPRRRFDRSALARAAFALTDGYQVVVVDHDVASVAASRLSSRARQKRSTLLVLDRLPPNSTSLPTNSMVKADLRFLVEGPAWSLGGTLDSGIISRPMLRVITADRQSFPVEMLAGYAVP